MGNDLSIWTLGARCEVLSCRRSWRCYWWPSVTSWGRHLQEGPASYPIRYGQAGSVSKRAFWSGGDLSTLVPKYRNQGTGGDRRAKHLRVGASGEFSRLRQQGFAHDQPARGSTPVPCGWRRCCEQDRLERNLAMLATVGSTSPYVGFVRHRVGDHERLSQPGVTWQQATPRRAVAPGDCGGADRHRHRPVRRHSGGCGVQTDSPIK